MTYCMVIATCSDMSQAMLLAKKIVEHKLASCVQANPITSVYRWEEQVHTEPEIRLVMKTKASSYQKLEQFIRENHSYEVPQIVSIPIENGYKPYLDWIDHNTIDQGLKKALKQELKKS